MKINSIFQVFLAGAGLMLPRHFARRDGGRRGRALPHPVLPRGAHRTTVAVGPVLPRPGPAAVGGPRENVATKEAVKVAREVSFKKGVDERDYFLSVEEAGSQLWQP